MFFGEKFDIFDIVVLILNEILFRFMHVTYFCVFFAHCMFMIGILIIQMEKEIRELTKQRDLAQSRVEDLLRMVGKEQISEKVVSIS